MIKKLLIVVVLAIAGFAGYVATLPDAYQLARSTVIAAPPETVFANLEDFRRWEAWSPWAKRDPTAKATFTGEPKGQGAVFGWAGNGDVGEGRMTITQSRPTTGLNIKLDFIKPFPNSSDVVFLLKPESGGTKVTWSMSGRQTFFEKAVCALFGGLERMVGPDYEQGLANLKAVSEGKKS